MSFNPGMLSALSNPGTWSPGATESSWSMPAWGGTAINAGTAAASTAAQLISQAVAANAQREFYGEQGGLDRDTRTQLARMQLAESAREANNTSKSNAYRMMLSAFSNQLSNTNSAFVNKRQSNNSVDSLLASAMLRGRG